MADLDDIINTLIAEAYGEGPKGMRAVAETIINRAAIRDLSFGDVVRQPAQYTGFFDPGPAVQEAQQSPRARSAAEAAWELALRPGDPTGGADYYHADYVSPYWAASMPQTAEIGAHQFYSSQPVPRIAPTPATRTVAPTPAGPLQRQYAYENAGTPLNGPIDDMIARSFGSVGIRPTAQSSANLADLFGPVSSAASWMNRDGSITSPAELVFGDDMESNIFAGGYGSLTPRPFGGSQTASADPVGSMPLFEAIADMFGGSEPPRPTGVAFPRDVRPNVDTDLGQAPTYFDLASMFDLNGYGPDTPAKAQDRLQQGQWATVDEEEITVADNTNPYGIQIEPLPVRTANVPVNEPRIAPVPQQRPAGIVAPVPRTRPAGIVAPPQPVQRPATVASAYTRPASSPTRQSSAASAIAEMFEPAGTVRAGTNGYAYAADGNGGYKQVGTFRPEGMTPAQQYDLANYMGRARASRSSGGSGRPGQGMSPVRGENRYDASTNSWVRK